MLVYVKKSRRPWPVVLAFLAIATLLGLGYGLNIVRKEGWEGLWHRKKALIKSAKPDAGPMLDEAERRAKAGE